MNGMTLDLALARASGKACGGDDEREAQEAEAADVVRAIRALTSPKRGRSRAAARRRARLMATWAGREAIRLIARDGAPSVAKWAATHTWVK